MNATLSALQQAEALVGSIELLQAERNAFAAELRQLRRDHQGRNNASYSTGSSVVPFSAAVLQQASLVLPTSGRRSDIDDAHRRLHTTEAPEDQDIYENKSLAHIRLEPLRVSFERDDWAPRATTSDLARSTKNGGSFVSAGQETALKVVQEAASFHGRLSLSESRSFESLPDPAPFPGRPLETHHPPSWGGSTHSMSIGSSRKRIPLFTPVTPLGGVDDLEHAIIKAKSTMRRAFESRTTEEGETLFHFVAENSWAATVALFLGGHGKLPGRISQRLYNAVFTGTFFCCCMACSVNSVIGTPPSYDLAMDLVHVWFHFFGLHAWLFWQAFAYDIEVRNLAASFGSSKGEDGPADSKWRTWIRRVSTSVLAFQFVVIVFGYVALPQPAIEYFSAAEAPLWERYFSAGHAILLWITIPQLVPSFAVSIGAFYFVCGLHVMDARRMLRSIQETEHPPASFDDDVEGQVKDCCAALEQTQDRLTHTCRNLSLLWVHQLTFAAVQLIVVVLHLSYILSGHPDISEWDRHMFYKVAFDLWTGFLGAGLFATAVLVPALVTNVYTALPRNVCKALRVRGFPIHAMTAVIDYFFMEAVGYRVGTCQVDERFASQITALIAMFISVLVGR